MYAIRLKGNSTLYKLAAEFAKKMDALRKLDAISSHVIYGEFKYKSSTWDKERRVVVKIAARIVKGGRYLTFKFCSSFPYKKEFWSILDKINSLPLLE